MKLLLGGVALKQVQILISLCDKNKRKVRNANCIVYIYSTVYLSDTKYGWVVLLNCYWKAPLNMGRIMYEMGVIAHEYLFQGSMEEFYRSNVWRIKYVTELEGGCWDI